MVNWSGMAVSLPLCQFSMFMISDADTITIENLKPNTSYMIRVKAKNDVGVSSPKELTVTTKSVRKYNS